MIDRKQLITALDNCVNEYLGETSTDVCSNCPYYDGNSSGSCFSLYPIMKGALDVLKDQEPRVLTLDELRGTRGEPVWMDEADSDNEPKIDSYVCEYSLTDVDTKDCVHHVIFEHSRQTLEDGYNHYWRCWSAKPSEEQWLNTKWDN